MVEVMVLGAVEIVANSQSRSALHQPVARAARVRRLLAVLVTTANSVASVDWIAESLWGDDPPSLPEGAVQNLVSRLRARLRAAGCGLSIVTRPPGYCLEMPRSSLDASLFEDLLSNAQAIMTTAPVQAAGLLDNALSLWRGSAYAEFADEEFARAEVARLSELRITAEEERVEVDLILGRVESAASRLQSLIAQHPLRERPHAQLMLAKHRAGQTGDALEVYQKLRRRLREELGIDPSAMMSTLQSAVLSGAPILDRPTLQGAVSGQGLHHVRSTAHSASAHLMGRDAALREALLLLSNEKLVTLTGAGGVGKTSLARAIAAELASSFADGIWLCELSTISHAESVAPALSTALRIPVRSDSEPRTTVVSFLSERQLLLVLDNCEHVVDEIASVVSDIIRSCPQVVVLATSQIPLQLDNERVLPLAPLPVPEVEVTDPAAVAEYEAVRLLLVRARQHGHEVQLSHATAGSVAELCRRLDGLPLAIELAAAHLGSLSPAELVDRLSWRFKVLRSGDSNGDPRHRTLRALVNWSFDLLNEREQRLFEALTVFAGPFTLSDAESVVLALEPFDGWDGADVISGIDTLVRQSVIVASRGPVTTYAMLETLHAFGAERLMSGPYAQAVPSAHATHYTQTAVDTYGHIYGAHQLRDVVDLERAMSEFRAAFVWALERDLATAVDLVGALNTLVEHKMLSEISDWAELLIDRLGEAPHPVDGSARVHAVAAAGARFAGNLERAYDLCTTGLRLAGKDDKACRIYLRFLLSEIACLRGDVAEVQRQLSASEADTPEEHEHPGLLAIMRGSRILLTAYGGHSVTAAEEALQLQVKAERNAWSTMAAWSLYIRGEALATVAPAQAEVVLEEALRRAREMDERQLAGVALVSLASVKSQRDDPHDAIGLFLQVVRHWRDKGDWTHQWTTLRNVADLLLRLHLLRPTAVLVAALLSDDRAARGYGTDTVRLVQTAITLESELDRDEYTSLVNQGSAMSDQQVVTFAVGTLGTAAHPAVGSTF